MIDTKIIPDEPIFNLILEASAISNFYNVGLDTFNLMRGLKVFNSSMTFGIMVKVYFLIL